MRICLIDVDSQQPNLALMRLSTYYKGKGHSVKLFRADLPYFPTRKRRMFFVPDGYDRYFASVVFSGTRKFVQSGNKEVVFGGSGVDLSLSLPEDVSECELDYSIYPENKTSYGFISRGCPRKCSFCDVPEKEGGIRQVASIDSIVRHKQVMFMDNNFLALSNHKELLQELIDKKIKCQFNQGLDFRFLDKENTDLLSKLNYWGVYYFAFDDWKYVNLIERKISLLSTFKPWNLRFFTYVHPDMEMSNIIKRIDWLKTHKMLPYIMRHIDCWKADDYEFYADIASYCNQVNIFKKMDFPTFLERRNGRKDRIIRNKSLYYESL